MSTRTRTLAIEDVPASPSTPGYTLLKFGKHLRKI